MAVSKSRRRSRQASHDAQQSAPTRASNSETLPPPTTHGEKVLPGGRIQPAGESGRRGIHPLHFFRINFRSTSKASMVCNLFWPFVPAALAVRYSLPDQHKLIFALAYVAMIPCANLIGFSGQELARKLPHVIGVLTEITLGSVVEIILLMVLLSKNLFEVAKAAILGSILATLLACLGFCFFVGGLRREEQTFDDAISEVGSGLLLVAGIALSIPAIFQLSLSGSGESVESLEHSSLQISRIISILLIISYAVYVFFQARTHHGIYTAIFEQDEHRDEDRAEDMAKAKLTMTECIVSLVIGIALVTIIAITLVLQIEHIISDKVSDAFVGLILVPLVEKFAEHLTAIDEANDNQMAMALSHVLGATLQTALFNGPLTVVVGWGLQKQMDLNFEMFNVVMLILAILAVSRFIQDQTTNYLEGFLLIMLYIAIAVSAYYYPNPKEGAEGSGSESSGGESAEA